ncbi:baseplate J/gp47 family protein [Deinococcus pimensis]|uniref:baseplate J/gp47 family protein n=1 Tax=Deinococcus pimensis TaxID=309888 RepID=UPI0004ACF148|nr:baseplate J/gp47 family protein [Deinococcus pimensis]
MLSVLAAGDLTMTATDYLPGSTVRTLLEIEAEAVADVERTVAALAASGFLATAAGEWLDAYVDSEYGNLVRQAALFTVGRVTLTAAPTSGPYDIPAGGLWVGTLSGLKYVTTEGGVLPQGGEITLGVQAESPGSAYNVPVSAIRVLHTPLPGVTVRNLTGWLTSAGRDRESDDSLRARARGRWPELGSGATRGAYDAWARRRDDGQDSAVTQVRVLDQHPRGQGTVDVILWGEGGIGTADVAAARAYIEARRPINDDVQVYAATARNVTIALTLFAPGADHARIEGEITTNLAALQRDTPIGGVLYRSAIIEAAMTPAGMVDATLPAAFTDVTLGTAEAAVLTPSFTWRG